jgi:beta-alanine--pyruvate transaminase
VIVGPVAGSAGVFVPPRGYLQRLREICSKHGILLIFDEVITGFGRLGTRFAADYFGVTPDLITFAKNVTNATVPMGGVIVRREVHDALMQGPEQAIELFHGYTYSGHPLAAAAALATLDLHRDEELYERAARLAPYVERVAHSLADVPTVVSIRNLGVIGAVELAPRAGAPGARGYQVFIDCFEHGVLARVAGDTLVFAPPFIAEHAHVDQMFDTLGAAIRRAAS